MNSAYLNVSADDTAADDTLADDTAADDTPATSTPRTLPLMTLLSKTKLPRTSTNIILTFFKCLPNVWLLNVQINVIRNFLFQIVNSKVLFTLDK